MRIGEADRPSHDGKYEHKSITNRREESGDIWDLGGRSSNERAVTKGIHNTEECNKEIHNWE